MKFFFTLLLLLSKIYDKRIYLDNFLLKTFLLSHAYHKCFMLVTERQKKKKKKIVAII